VIIVFRMFAPLLDLLICVWHCNTVHCLDHAVNKCEKV